MPSRLGVYPTHAREAPAHYEVPMSFSTFVTPRGSRSPFSEVFRNSSVGRHSSTATSPSACSSPSPSPDVYKTRRCTCAMWRNIYCGVCDVELQSEDDPCFQSKEGDLRYVPVTNLIRTCFSCQLWLLSNRSVLQRWVQVMRMRLTKNSLCLRILLLAE
jgi:hypothetical protein